MDDNFNTEFDREEAVSEEETVSPATDDNSGEVYEAPTEKPVSVTEVTKPAENKGMGKKGVFITLGVVFICALCFVCGTLLGNGALSPNGGVIFGGDVNSSKAGNNGEATNQNGNESRYEFGTASSGESYSVASVAAMTMDTVVEITTETVTTNGFMQQYVSEGAGSGVIIREDGVVVTNHHVIDGASSITVRLRSGKEYDAVLLGTDSNSDIALLKIEAEGLPAAVLGDSSGLSVGDPVVAIGNPLGSLGGTVTDGIISALERQISIDGQVMTLLQTNAAINPGNSGGGLFNTAGELIGIVNAKSSGSGIEGLGFAIPINTARPIFEDLLNYGYVKGRVSLGVSLLDIYSESSVRYYGVPSQGTYINSVTSGSDAAKAGLKSGDMIKSINGVSITGATAVDQILNGCQVGDSITVTVVRVVSSGWFNYNTEELTVEITLSEYIPGESLIS